MYMYAASYHSPPKSGGAGVGAGAKQLTCTRLVQQLDLVEFKQKPTATSMLFATVVAIIDTGVSDLPTSRRGVRVAGGVGTDAQQWSCISESSSKSNAKSESAGSALSMSASSSKQSAGAAVFSHE